MPAPADTQTVERLVELVTRRVLLALADALILVQRDGRASFEEARADAMKAVAEFAPKQPDADLVLSYRRWSARLAKDAGGLRPWMWAKLHGRRLPG